MIQHNATVSSRMSCDIKTKLVRSLGLLCLCDYLHQPSWNLIKKSIIFVWQALFKQEREKKKKRKITLMSTSIKYMTVPQSLFNWIPLQLFMPLNLACWYPVSSEVSQWRSSLKFVSSPSSNEHRKMKTFGPMNKPEIFSDI